MLSQTGKYTTVSAIVDLSLKFGSVTILDATADVSTIYDSYRTHQEETTMFYKKDEIRWYQNTTLHIVRGY